MINGSELKASLHFEFCDVCNGGSLTVLNIAKDIKHDGSTSDI
jgi:hypothetical protein